MRTMPRDHGEEIRPFAHRAIGQIGEERYRPRARSALSEMRPRRATPCASTLRARSLREKRPSDDGYPTWGAP